MFSKLPLKYALLLLFGTLALTGCKTPLKQGWHNFNAYFNTYYNANLNFERGLEKNRNQKPELNPERPIRIHPPPNRAGQSEFDNAIDKGAKILRDHEQSKFVDDALLLIGRSYFYQSEFYNAEQKFRELYRTTDNQELYQKAVLWRGRVYLEMDRYQEGITFLQNELEGYEEEWEEEIRAEIQSVLAELYVQVDDHDAAIEQLSQALGRIDRNITSARAHFLQGQLLERKGEYEKAFRVYQKVDEFHPFYDLVYESRRKEAEMARNMRQYKKALELYTNMYRDDKNFEIRTELLYEIGKTQQEWERVEEAEITYKRVLHGEFQKPESVTRAKSYYGLAELNRWHYLDFKRAAAYYDSAASVGVEKERLPDSFDAPQMSESFGEYTELRNTIQHQDSLLWLAELPESKRDSVINVIREKKLEKLKEQQEQRQESQSSMVNVQEKVSDVEQNPDSDSGFLNYKDEKSVTESKQRFSAVWGRRRLMDNWRRVEALRNTLSEQKGDTTAQQQDGMSREMRRRKLQVTVDVESIPFEEEDKKKARDKIAKSQYQLGNLFFLSLNMLDSAKTNYRKVIDNYSDHKISAQALYSLSELYYVNNDTVEARKWADRLIEQWPNSRFAQRAKERFNLQEGLDALDVNEQDTVSNRFHHLYDSIRTSANNAELSKGAEKLKQFAYKISESSLAPHALFESAKLYMQAAREDSVYQAKEKDWFKARESWQKKRREFESLQDSANTVVQDTTLSDSLRTYWQGIADSSLSEPEFAESFPFLGAKWDTSRVLLSRIKDNYPEFTFNDRINRLQETLELPSKFQNNSSQKSNQKEEARSMPPDSVTFYNCSQLQEELTVVGGVMKFMSTIQIPDTLNSQIKAAPDTLIYEVAIDTSGYPLKFKLVEGQEMAMSDSLAGLIESSMRKELRFDPLKEEGEPVFAICRFKMPLAFLKD